MIPGSGLAIALALALVPGWLFLRCTERVRRPQDRGPLLALLEVIAVGLATTGAILLVIAVADPEWVRSSAQDPLATSSSTRWSVVLIAVLLTAASGLALIAAYLLQRCSSRQFRPAVWEATLEESRSGATKHVAIELKDGRVFDGQLHAYTLENESAKQIAIQGEIWMKTTTRARVRTGLDYLIVSDSEISMLGVGFRDPATGRPVPREAN